MPRDKHYRTNVYTKCAGYLHIIFILKDRIASSFGSCRSAIAFAIKIHRLTNNLIGWALNDFQFPFIQKF